MRRTVTISQLASAFNTTPEVIIAQIYLDRSGITPDHEVDLHQTFSQLISPLYHEVANAALTLNVYVLRDGLRLIGKPLEEAHRLLGIAESTLMEWADIFDPTDHLLTKGEVAKICLALRSLKEQSGWTVV